MEHDEFDPGELGSQGPSLADPAFFPKPVHEGQSLLPANYRTPDNPTQVYQSSSVQRSVAHLVRRGLLDTRRGGVTEALHYTVIRPWRR